MVTTVSVGVKVVDVTGIVKVTVMSKLEVVSSVVAATPLKTASEVVVSVIVISVISEEMVTSVSIPGTVTATVEPSISIPVS